MQLFPIVCRINVKQTYEPQYLTPNIDTNVRKQLKEDSEEKRIR